MKNAQDIVWIFSDRGRLVLDRWSSTAPTDEQRIHLLGGVRLARNTGVNQVRFDGRIIDRETCDRLLMTLDRLSPLTSRTDFEVWSGPQRDADGWIRHSAIGVAAAKSFVRTVAAVATASDGTRAIRATPERLERLLLERRAIFDEVLAAWLLDRAPGSAAIARLFQPDRLAADEGMKVVRRFGENLVFDAYRPPTGHQWVDGQGARMLGADLGAVRDRRLAQSVRGSTEAAWRSNEPLLERISGIFLTDKGAKVGEYYRLSLPLATGDGEQNRAILIATKW